MMYKKLGVWGFLIGLVDGKNGLKLEFIYRWSRNVYFFRKESYSFKWGDKMDHWS